MTKNPARAKSILDRSFRYTSSAETDLKKTFARIRREQRLQERVGRCNHGKPHHQASEAHRGLYAIEGTRLAPEPSW